MKGPTAQSSRRALQATRLASSTGDLGILRSALKVKTQYESLKRSGIRRSRANMKKKIVFSFLEVKEFPMILGDNPSCTDGPPVTIDWAYDPKTQFVLDVDTFESMRGVRRINKQLILPRSVREKCLARIGVSKNDMIAAIRQMRKDKHSRMVSSQQVGMDNLHEATEKVTSGLKKMFVFKTSQYEKTLKKACSNAPSHPMGVSSSM